MVLIGLLVVLFPYNTYALSVSPSINEIKIDAGKPYKSELIIENNSNQAVSISLNVKEFRGGERPGIPEFIEDTASGIIKWLVASPRSFVLGAGEKQKVSVVITSPSSSRPGGYYVAVFATGEPKQKENVTVIAKQSVAVLYLLTVSGQISREATISKFGVKNKFINFFPSRFSFLVENTGPVHIQPHGQIRINALFSPYVRAFELNPENVRVLPNSKREISTIWNGEDLMWWSSLNPFRFGIYDAELFFDDMKLQGILTTRFIIVSPVAILIVLIGGTLLVVKMRRR